MALLDKDKVGGHGGEMSHAHPLPAGEFFDVAALPRGEPVTGVILRDLGARPVYELRSAKGVRLVDATSGELVHVDEQMARDVGSLMNEAPIRKRSEEHTSELQSLMRISYAVFCLKKKKTREKTKTNT